MTSRLFYGIVTSFFSLSWVGVYRVLPSFGASAGASKTIDPFRRFIGAVFSLLGRRLLLLLVTRRFIDWVFPKQK